MISRRGIRVSKNVIAKIRKELTVCPVSAQSAFPKRFKVYVETPDAVYVPRFWWPEPCRHDNQGQDAHFEFSGVLHPELSQPQAAQAVLHRLDTIGGAVMCLPTGFGKTCTALYVASKIGKKTLVVVHKAFLKDQWKDRIRAFLPSASVTEIQGPVADTSGDVVVAMIQTLVSRKFPPSFFEPFGLMIMDECHHIAAEVFSRAMFGLCMPKTLGLSATPTRKDGLTRVLHWFLGPMAFEIKRTGQDDVTVVVARFDCPRFKEAPPMNKRGDICHTSVITELTKIAERTDRIVELVQKYAHRDVLVLSHRRDHCKAIVDALVSRGIDSGVYLGGDKAPPATKVIVATYALTSEGFDCPRLNTLVLATPASDVNQSCGRVLRGNNTSAGPVIVDILDAWGVCFAQHSKRRRYYREAGFAVVPENAGQPHAPGPGFDDVQDHAHSSPETRTKAHTYLFVD